MWFLGPPLPRVVPIHLVGFIKNMVYDPSCVVHWVLKAVVEASWMISWLRKSS